MEPTHYKNASDISCNNMTKLAKKHADENHNQFLNRMISFNCGKGDKDGYFVTGEWINPKHCHNKRDEYNYDWWDKNYKQPCIGEEFLINTRMKTFNTNNNENNNCTPTDFSQANVVSRSDNNGLFANYKYNTPKVCGMI